MKLNKVLCLFLMLAVVFAFASCEAIQNSPVGGLIEKLPFVKAKFAVEFDSNGGSEVEAQTVVEGELATAPAAPVKEGYTFLGWFNGETEWSFDTPVNEDMTLVARWEKLPDPCAHVDKDDNGKCDKCGVAFEDGSDKPAPTNYHIVYMDGSEKLNLQPSSYNSESTGLKLPTPPAKDNYEFVGWYMDANFTTKVDAINVNANCNLVFFAKYAPISYKIDYQLDGGTNDLSNPTVYTVEDLPVSLKAPTKEAYDFVGWFSDANCTVAFEGITEDNIGNVTVYAKWELTPVPYTITYLDNEYNVIGTDTFYESDSDQPLRPAYELEGYIFISWVNPRNPMVTYDCIPAGTAMDITVMAYMQRDVVTHNVNYYINGELFQTAVFEEELGLETLLTANKAGYDFDGWYANPELTGDKVTSIPANTLIDVNLYGSHTIVTYTVKYFDGDIELAFDPATYQISDTDIQLPVIPDKVGYEILGWYDADGNKYTSIAAGTYGDLILYATYESNTYTITYHLNGGVNSEDNVEEYAYNNIPTLYDPADRDGYLFYGWYLDATFTGEAVEDLSAFANQDISLFAKWLPISEDDGENLTPSVPF